MAEEVGAIRYTTEVDTSDTLTAEKQIDKATTNIANDFKKVDVAAKKTQTQMTKTSKAVKTGLSGVGRGAGQAGIQVQQFIGQVQGGQSAMLALSQQSADLGFVLGAPLVGAIVGISASIAGMLLPNLFKTTEGIIELDESITKLTKNFDKLSESQQQVARNALAEQIKKQRKEAAGLAAEVNRIQSELIVAERQDGMLESLFGGDADKLKTELTKVKASLVTVKLSIKDSEKQLNDLGNQGEKFTETSKTITNGLTAQILALGAGEEAAFRFATAQQLGLKAGEMIPPNIDAQISALFRLKKAQEEIKLAEATKKRAGAFAAGVTKRGLSPEEKLQADLDQVVRDKALISLEEFEAAKTSIEKQQSDLRIKQRSDETKQAISSQQMMTGAILGFVSATTGALMSGMDEQSGAYKALFAIQKATAIASTIIAAESAAATALAPPPLGLGPVAGIPLSNLVRGLGYASAGIIAGTAIAGGRQFGGPVNGGDAYRVGEAGPEIFTAGGKHFMIPGENGNVIANDDLGGGGGFTQNVEIINNTPANVTSQTSNDGKQLRIFINEVANQINNNQGVIVKALRASTDTKFKANS